jgi:sugar phosphate isomerase/epimerase
MRGDPHDVMTIGLVHFMAYPAVSAGRGPIIESLGEICRDNYFQLIEVSQIRRDSVREEARQMVRDAGKQVMFGAQPVFVRRRIDPSLSDPAERIETLDYVKEILEEAMEWQPSAFIVPSGPDPGEDGRENSLRRLLSSLKELCEASRTRGGPPILLETFDRQIYAKNRLVGPTQEAVEVAKAISAYFNSFGLVLDLAHLALLMEDPAESVKLAADYIKHVHIGNTIMRQFYHPAYGDEHPPLGIPEGELGAKELTAFLKALFDVGYLREGSRNTVSFEVKPLKGQTAAQAVDAGKQVLDEAWKML